MKNRLTVLLLLSFFVLCPILGADRHVILISIDGLKSEYYLNADELGLKIPNLRGFMKEGTYAEGALSVLPTVTFPSHTSMITGVNPSRHGIFNNTIFDPDGSKGGGWYWFYQDLKAPTLFDAARARNLTAAAVWWPVMVGAPVAMNIPDFPAANLREAKVLLNLSNGERLQTVIPSPESLIRVKDDTRARVAAHFIRAKPDFMAIHLIELDGAQHANGPMTPPAFETLERIDGYLGQIFAAVREAGMWESTTIVITSDHGFMPVERQVRPGVLLVQEGLIELDKDGYAKSWSAVPWSAGGALAIYIHPQAAAGTKEKVDKIVRSLLDRRDSGVKQAYWAPDIEKMAGFPAAHVVLEAGKGFSFSGALTGDLVANTSSRGSHGYPPEVRELRASFLVRGPAIKRGQKIGIVRLIDIAPTIARILDLKMENVEGRVLEEVFNAGDPKAAQ